MVVGLVVFRDSSAAGSAVEEAVVGSGMATGVLGSLDVDGDDIICKRIESVA